MEKYLIGCVDKGAAKTFSSGAFDFRATFVSLVLFQGAYVWIKFRYLAPLSCRKRKDPPLDTITGVQLADASNLKGFYARAVKDKDLPLDTITGVQLADASNLKGFYARAVKDKDPPLDTITGVQLADASDLKGVYTRAVKDKYGTITYKYEPRFKPPREKVDDGTTRKLNRLSLGVYHTRDEAKIVLQIARFYYDRDEGCVKLYDGQFKFSIPPMNEQERGLAGQEKREWVTNKAKQVYADLRIQKWNFEQLSVGNRTGARSSHDSDIRASEIPSVSSADALEVPSCPAPLPPCDVVDDYCETLSGLGDMIDELLCPNSANLLPQQSSLNCQRDPVLQQLVHLQQLVYRQKQQLEVYALQNVDLEHQLWESQIQNSGLEHQLREAQIQNSELQYENNRLQQEKHLRTQSQQFVNFQMAT